MSPLPSGYQSNRGINVKGFRFDLAGLFHKHYGTNPDDASPAPAAAITNGYLTSFAGPNNATLEFLKAAFTGSIGVTGRPDWARNVVITVTHGAAVVALSGVITGKDVLGRDMVEAWNVTAGGTSKTFTGAKAFSQVDKVTVTSVADATTDSVIVGTGTVFGIDLPVSVPKPVLETVDGAIVTTGTVVAGSANAAADPLGTYSPATAPNGARIYDVWVIIENEEAVA